MFRGSLLLLEHSRCRDILHPYQLRMLLHVTFSKWNNFFSILFYRIHEKEQIFKYKIKKVAAHGSVSPNQLFVILFETNKIFWWGLSFLIVFVRLVFKTNKTFWLVLSFLIIFVRLVMRWGQMKVLFRRLSEIFS